MAERRKLQKEQAQLDAEREMLQVQQEECASQVQKVGLSPKLAPSTWCEVSTHNAASLDCFLPAQHGTACDCKALVGVINI